MVFKSLSFKSSGTEKSKVDAILAKISTCFTVSIPRSASRSRSSSSMSAAYPVCSAIICFTFAMGTAAGSSTGEDTGVAGALAATAVAGAVAMTGIRTGSGTGLFFSGLSVLLGSESVVPASWSPATTHKVLSIILSSGFWEPVIFLSQRW